MGTFTTKVGLTSVYNGDNVTQQSGRLWRPWTGTEETTGAHKVSLDDLILLLMLYWPKSRWFDYLYQEAEMLLRNYPVQATICPYEDSSSDEDSDDEEEEIEKELN
uniref:Ripply transcriptional repressor 2 n=1 Tax=Sander lucioperca TaxID=283035 RepID=A0A8D0CSF9_SANLU